MMAEGLALMDLRDMALDHRPLEGVERVEQRDRGMRECGRIDDDASAILARLMDPVDQFVFAVGTDDMIIIVSLPNGNAGGATDSIDSRGNGGFKPPNQCT